MTRLGPVPTAPLAPCTCGTWLCPECGDVKAPPAPVARMPLPKPLPRTLTLAAPRPVPEPRVPAYYALDLPPLQRAARYETLLHRLRAALAQGRTHAALVAIEHTLGIREVVRG